MSKLQDRLDRIRVSFVQQAPAEAQEIMHRAKEELRASGILTRIPTPGSSLPEFALRDTDGQTVRSSDLLGGGPLIMTFYRGLW